jgi:hypothetical protein
MRNRGNGARKRLPKLDAGDATDASSSGGEMASVIQTDATKYCRSERATSVPKYGRFMIDSWNIVVQTAL